MRYQIDSDLSKESKGQVNYSNTILLSIINLATKEIEGVSKLSDNFGSIAKKWFTNKYYDGVKVLYENNAMTIDIFINVKYGNCVTDVAYRVQENVKNGILSMVEIAINQINVHVMGVDFISE